MNKSAESEDKDEKSKEDQKPVVIRNCTDLQRLKLERLMKNPEKPVLIPEKPKERGVPVIPDFVRNVMGSSAGAGSGEFHVYRHLRRKEYARQKYMKEKAERERLDEEHRAKLEENKRKAEERTAKKRAKRLKKKQKAKKKAEKVKTQEASESEEEEESENESETEHEDSRQESETTDDVGPRFNAESECNDKASCKDKNEAVEHDNNTEKKEIKNDEKTVNKSCQSMENENDPDKAQHSGKGSDELRETVKNIQDVVGDVKKDGKVD